MRNEEQRTTQSELFERSPSWVQRTLNDETTPPECSDLHEYAETSPYSDPKWTRHNGWRKWHAERDCGAETVYVIEDPLADSTTEEDRAWKLYCARCGAVNWDEILYLHRDWYYEQAENGDLGWKFIGRFGGLWLDPDMVTEVGGVPSDDEVKTLIRRSWYESEAQNRMAPLMPWEES